MQSGWYARLFFAVVTAVAVAGVVSGTACTRWGQPGPTVPTLAPLSSIFVNPNTGSDTSGNGSQTNPYRTLTKAVEVLDAAKSVSPNGVMINLSGGDYDASKGEKFPIVMLKSASITGSNYGTGVGSGSFINGMGEDTIFEKLVHAPPHSVYTTLEVVPGVSVSVNGIYVGSAEYFAAGFARVLRIVQRPRHGDRDRDFGAGIASRLRDINGVLVAGGSFTCASCSIKGNDFGIGATVGSGARAIAIAIGHRAAIGNGPNDYAEPLGRRRHHCREKSSASSPTGASTSRPPIRPSILERMHSPMPFRRWFAVRCVGHSISAAAALQMAATPSLASASPKSRSALAVRP